MVKRLATITALVVTLAGVASTASAAPHITYTGYTSIGLIRAYNSKMCLTLVSNHPNQKIDWAPCGLEPLQIWHAVVIKSNMVLYLANNPQLCIDGNRQAGEYVWSYDCTEHTPINSQIILYGGYKHNTINGIWSAKTLQFVTFQGGTGPAVWQKGRPLIIQLIFGINPKQKVIFEGGWTKHTVTQ